MLNFTPSQTLDSSDSRLFNPSEEVILPWSCCRPASIWTNEDDDASVSDSRVTVDVEQPVAMANTIRGRLVAKRLEEEEAERRKKAEEEEEARNPQKTKTATPGPYSPEVMIREGPVMEEKGWCRYGRGMQFFLRISYVIKYI